MGPEQLPLLSEEDNNHTYPLAQLYQSLSNYSNNPINSVELTEKEEEELKATRSNDANMFAFMDSIEIPPQHMA